MAYLVSFTDVPNRLLSETSITSLASLKAAIAKLHTDYHVPHVVVTSVRFQQAAAPGTLSVIGSTRRADGSPRLFRIEVPDLDCLFVGTGDMFAALTVVRLREAAIAAKVSNITSWLSPDVVEARELPLANAIEKVLASMHLILEKTQHAMHEEMEAVRRQTKEGPGMSDQERHLRQTKAAEVRLIRNACDLKDPAVVYRAQPL